MSIEFSQFSLTTALPREKSILGDTSFSLPGAAVTLVEGESGSGKSLLLYSLAGILGQVAPAVASRGIMMLDGAQIVTHRHNEQASLILENPYTQMSGLKRTVYGELCLPLEIRGSRSTQAIDALRSISERLKIAHLLQRDPRTLSGGELELVLWASAVVTDPRLLLLDRAMTGLDNVNKGTVAREIQRIAQSAGGHAILVEERENCSSVALSHILKTLGPRGAQIVPAGPREPSVAERLFVDLLEGIPSKDECPTSGDVIMELEGLGHHYPSLDSWTFRGLDLCLTKGDLLLLLGRNGSGKTTLCKVIAGILDAQEGKVRIKGEARPEAFRRHVAIAWQNPDLQICSRSVLEEVDRGLIWGGCPKDEARRKAMEWLAQVGLADWYMHSPAELSRSQKKRLSVACTLALGRDIAILDEPSQFCSHEEVLQLGRAIAEVRHRGTAVICITHDHRMVESVEHYRVFVLG